MEKIKHLIIHLYRSHFLRYVFVGGTTFIIDFATLYTLHEAAHFHLILATSIAYWLSITYNFILNRWWTFSASDNAKLHKHLVSYAILLGCNYLFTVVFVWGMSHLIRYEIAKVVAVALQIAWTYPIYKYVIFNKKESAES